MKTVTVKVRQVSSVLDSDEDEGVAGRYKVIVYDGVPANHVAGVALDVFHSHVAVDCLDDFEFTVLDGKKELVESEDYVAYSGENSGRLVD